MDLSTAKLVIAIISMLEVHCMFVHLIPLYCNTINSVCEKKQLTYLFNSLTFAMISLVNLLFIQHRQMHLPYSVQTGRMFYVHGLATVNDRPPRQLIVHAAKQVNVK